jgi:hypothetical protein
MEKMNFKITYTLHAKRVERWIRAVKRDFLDAAEIKVNFPWLLFYQRYVA